MTDDPLDELRHGSPTFRETPASQHRLRGLPQPTGARRLRVWWVLLLCCAGLGLQIWLSLNLNATGGWPESWVYAIVHWPNDVVQQILLAMGIASLVILAISTKGFSEVGERLNTLLNVVVCFSLATLAPIALSLACLVLTILLAIAALAAIFAFAFAIANG
jgi:hypothetical protein